MATQRQKIKAANLWALAVISNMDCVEDDDLCNDVCQMAIDKAREKLDKMGFHHTELSCTEACIEAAIDS